MKYVYIAGPLTKGDRTLNVRNAMLVAIELIKHGYHPYCPHLSHFLQLLNPLPYETWMKLCLAWLVVCDALIRLPGESPGSDREEAFCRLNHIPIYYSVEEFLEAVRNEYQ